MQTEIEVKLPRVDIAVARQQLEQAGATLVHPERLMRRVNMEAAHHRDIHAFLRIRDEGDKTTLTYKQRTEYDASTIDGVRELEVTVDDFDKTVEIFRLSGLPPITYQETKRETWRLGDVSIEIDQWPWIDPYVELEGPSVEALQSAVKAIGWDWSDTIACQIDQIYLLQYSFTKGSRGVISIPNVVFDADLPEQLESRKQ